MSGAGHYRAGATLLVVGGLTAAAILLLIALSSVRLGEQRPRRPAPPRATAQPAPAVVQSATPTVPDSPVPQPLTLEEAVMHPTHHLGTPVRVSGQVAIPPGIAAGQLVLYRLADACCESDAVPMALVVQLPAGAAVPEVGSWQEAIGTLSLVEGGTTPGPLLTATQLYHLPPPDPHQHPAE
jgi:hypothetical protein